ncbi:MAG TPA: histidine kinase [Allosphingosinicella sp.]
MRKTLPDQELAGRTAVERRRLDRDVLLITCVLWAAHWGVLSTSSTLLKVNHGIPSMVARLLVAALGALSSVGVYGLLRRRSMSFVPRFAAAVLMCVPICLALSVANELAWVAITPYYRQKYGIGPSELFTEKGLVVLKEAGFTFGFFIWVYVSWCALYVGAVFAAELRDRDSRLASAQAAANQAQLMALRFQLNPHFLFNTLNTLSGLIAMRSLGAAEDVVINLSSFLRYSLASGSAILVPLRQEIEAQKMYLGIEEKRFGDRITIRYRVSEEAEAGMVPNLILQPLVENAVKHGVAPSGIPVAVELGAVREGTRLRLWIENSAADLLGATGAPGLGIGAANVHQRLAASYGDQASFRSEPTAQGGWRCEIEMPWVQEAE